MKPIATWIPVLLSVSLVCTGLVISPVQATPKEDSSNWAMQASLPKLRVIPIRPILEAEAFGSFSISSGYSYAKPGITPPSAPFETDAEAEQLARRFIADHFGPIPLDLKTANILRSASGREQPFDETDRGHTIRFKTYWHGINIEHCYAMVYIKGRAVHLAGVNLGVPTVLPNSNQILITRLKAVEAWQQLVVKRFKAPQGIEPQVVDLVYLWSGPDNGSLNDAETLGSVLAPQWEIKAFAEGEALLVDAYTGKVWRND